jgi:hypothetical protein
MRILFTFLILILFLNAGAQAERDTVLKRCPVFITDTVSSNNFFIEARPATLKVYRVRGKLTIAVEQRDQFFTLFFHDRKLRTGQYDIVPGSRGGREVEATYSFKTGDQASYISLSRGTIDVSYDKESKFWMLKVNGMIANLVDRSVTYYKVRADLPVL